MAAAARVVEDKAVVVVDVRPVVEAEAAKVVVGRAVAVVDARPAVAVDKVVDKVVEEEADARLVVVAADPPVVAVEWEVEEAVVDVLPAVAGAAETVNSLSSSGASRECAAPRFFIDALLHRDTFVAAVDRAAARHVFPAAPLALAG